MPASIGKSIKKSSARDKKRTEIAILSVCASSALDASTEFHQRSIVDFWHRAAAYAEH